MRTMKSFMMIVIYAVGFCFLNVLSARAESGWYSFDMTDAMDTTSPFVTEQPNHDVVAGEHGFNKRVGAGFVFEDGTPAKFWGTSLNYRAAFPIQSDADAMVQKLSFFGFNAVRLHVIDQCFAPYGIFQDLNPSVTNPQQKVTGVLSSSMLGRLDYLLKQCKSSGIYVDLCLLVLRQFSEADGVVSAAELGDGAKPVAIFDPKLRELQKQYAKDLLTHYNPYTGLTYADDPTIALVETINECWLMRYWKDGKLDNSSLDMTSAHIPLYYITMLDNLWNDWLQRKYTTPQNVYSAYGDPVADNSQRLIAQMSSNWYLEVHSPATATVEKGTSSAVIHVTKALSTDWLIQYNVASLNLTTSKAYVVRFKGSADRNYKLKICAQMNQDPWGFLGSTKDIDLDQTTKQYEFVFVPSQNFSNAKIGFWMGYQEGNVTLSNIEIYEEGFSLVMPQNWNLSTFDFNRPIYRFLNMYPAQTKSDVAEFYKDLQKDYAADMTSYLRDICGVKVPITVFSGAIEPEDKLTEDTADFLDHHTYWDHPYFPNAQYDSNDFRICGQSMFLDGYQGMIGDIKSFNSDNSLRPYTITEWQHCYPNPYAYESPLLMGIEGAKNGWDGLFQFTFFMGLSTFNAPGILNYFETFSNPQQLILTALGGRLYQQNSSSDLVSSALQNGVLTINTPSMRGAVGFIAGKTFNIGIATLTPSNNGAVIVFSPSGAPLEQASKLVLVALNDVKNTNSYWDANGKFAWGSGPVILKGMAVNVGWASNAKLNVYAMDTKGTRSVLIGSANAGDALSIDTLAKGSPWFEFNLQDPPTISGFSPGSGDVGSSVTIYGENYTSISSVSFNNISTSFTVISPTEIEAIVPAGAASGFIKVVASGGTAISSMSFEVNLPPSVALSSGTAGQTINVGSNAVYTINISKVNFTGPVTFSISGLPAGATAVFSENPTSVSLVTLTVGTSSGTTLGVSNLMVNATASGIAISPISLSLTVNPAARVVLSSSPTSASIRAGSKAYFTISLSRTNFTAPVTLSISGLPTGATAAFSKNSTTASSLTLTISTSSRTVLGTKTITLKASGSGIIINSINLSLTVRKR